MFAESTISILDTKAVKWTPIDAVRIGYEEERSFPTLWVAVLYYRCYASGMTTVEETGKGHGCGTAVYTTSQQRLQAMV